MLKNVSFSLRAGEILGVAALEGQGQQELFDCIAGVRRQDGGEIVAHGRKLKLSHPGDAIAAGLVLVPGESPAGAPAAALDPRERRLAARPQSRRIGASSMRAASASASPPPSSGCRSTPARDPNCAG